MFFKLIFLAEVFVLFIIKCCLQSRAVCGQEWIRMTWVAMDYYNSRLVHVQGISYWSVTSKSALRGRRIHNLIKLWCLVGSGGLDIWVSSTSFQKSNIGWPQQPPTERVSNIHEKLDFWWSIPQKRTAIGHLGAGDDPTIRFNKVFDEMMLSRSLRPLMLLKLWRSLGLLRF